MAEESASLMVDIDVEEEGEGEGALPHPAAQPLDEEEPDRCEGLKLIVVCSIAVGIILVAMALLIIKFK